jgi:hypothetical protein
MLCRRDTPRNAFENPHIRAERGTCSALTADADEFGTARARSEDRRRAQKKRRTQSGACLYGEETFRLLDRQAACFRGRETARLEGLDVRWSLVLCVWLATVWVCGQFSGRSMSVEQSDRATKQRFAFYSQKKLTARFFCDRKRVVCDLAHFSRVQRRVLNARSACASRVLASVP